jgi:hypothetical protein
MSASSRLYDDKGGVYYDLFWMWRQSQHFISLFSFSRHHMFRPLQAILRWNIHSRFLKATTPTTDPFLGHTIYYSKLCYVIYYSLIDVKTAEDVLKIAILYKNVVLLKLTK